MIRVRPLIGVFALLVLAGCTRSLEYPYRPATTRVAAAEKARAMSFGVAKFEDKRSWVDASDSKGQSYVAQQGAWKFALTHEGHEYVPVNGQQAGTDYAVGGEILVLEFVNEDKGAKA